MFNIKTAIKIVKIVKNWPLFFADFFKIIPTGNIEYALRNGIRLNVRAKTFDRGAIAEIFINKLYNPPGFEINETDVVFDIGAHIGIFSIYASMSAKKGKIYAFEPMPENFMLFKQNMELNNTQNVSAYNKAVAKKRGYTIMNISTTHTGAHSMYYNFGSGAVKVQTISLNDFIKKNKIRKMDFLKMDCEGTEYEILYNLPKKVLSSIKKISMEYHNIDEKYNVTNLVTFLEKNGFEVNAIINKCTTSNLLYAKQKSIQ